MSMSNQGQGQGQGQGQRRDLRAMDILPFEALGDTAVLAKMVCSKINSGITSSLPHFSYMYLHFITYSRVAVN